MPPHGSKYERSSLDFTVMLGALVKRDSGIFFPTQLFTLADEVSRRGFNLSK